MESSVSGSSLLLGLGGLVWTWFWVIAPGLGLLYAVLMRKAIKVPALVLLLLSACIFGVAGYGSESMMISAVEHGNRALPHIVTLIGGFILWFIGTKIGNVVYEKYLS